MGKHLHAVEFDGTTFGMEVEVNTKAWRNFKNAVKREKCISSTGKEIHRHTVPFMKLGAIMREAHWLVTERHSFDRFYINGFLDDIVVYVKYTDEPIDFRNRRWER